MLCPSQHRSMRTLRTEPYFNKVRMWDLRLLAYSLHKLLLHGSCEILALQAIQACKLRKEGGHEQIFRCLLISIPFGHFGRLFTAQEPLETPAPAVVPEVAPVASVRVAKLEEPSHLCHSRAAAGCVQCFSPHHLRVRHCSHHSIVSLVGRFLFNLLYIMFVLSQFDVLFHYHTFSLWET